MTASARCRLPIACISSFAFGRFRGSNVVTAVIATHDVRRGQRIFLEELFGIEDFMGNNRKANRVRFEHKHTVSVMSVDGTWRRSCILVDVSASGAKLEVEGSTDPLKAQEFFLVLSSTGLAFRRCELIWVDGSQVGVHFVTAKTKRKASAEKSLVRSQ